MPDQYTTEKVPERAGQRGHSLIKRICLVSWSLGGCISLTLAAGPKSVRGAEFQVAGDIEVYRPASAKEAEIDSFHVFFRTNTWVIQLHQRSVPDAGTNAVLMTYVSFNRGSDVFTIAYSGPEALEHLLSNPKTPTDWKRNPAKVAINLAWADHSHIPHADSTPALPVLFYTFCAGQYLDSVSGNRLEPPYFIDGKVYSYDDGATSVSAHYLRSSLVPFLPVHIDFLCGDKWLVGPSTWRKTPKGLDGFTNATFNCGGFTNAGLLYIPSSFNMVVFSPIIKNGVMRLLPTLDVQGQVLAVASSCRPADLQPSLNGLTTISDKRFSEKGSAINVTYVADKWLTKAEVMRLPQFAEARLDHEAAIAAARKSLLNSRFGAKYMSIIVGSIALLTLIPVLFAIRRKRGSSARTTSK